MTKAELEKEAIEYAKPLDIKYGGSFVRTTEEVKQAYFAGAEPREKKIEELEQKLEQTEKDLADYQFNYPNIKELEQENAELKQINSETLAQLNLDNGELIIENEKLRKQLDALSGDIPWNKLKDVSEVTKKLTEAKELLNEFMRISKASDEDFEHDYSELIGEAEQFLNDEVKE